MHEMPCSTVGESEGLDLLSRLCLVVLFFVFLEQVKYGRYFFILLFRGVFIDVSLKYPLYQLTCFQYLLNEFRGYFRDASLDTPQKIYENA